MCLLDFSMAYQCLISFTPACASLCELLERIDISKVLVEW